MDNTIIESVERLQDLCEQQRQLLEKMDARLRAESEKDADELHDSLSNEECATVLRTSRNDGS